MPIRLSYSNPILHGNQTEEKVLGIYITTVVKLWTVGLHRQLAVYDRTRMNGSTTAQRQPNRTRAPTAAAKDCDRRSRTLQREESSNNPCG